MNTTKQTKKLTPMDDGYYAESGLIDNSLLLEDHTLELQDFHEQEIASRQHAEDEEWMYKHNPRENY